MLIFVASVLCLSCGSQSDDSPGGASDGGALESAQAEGQKGQQAEHPGRKIYLEACSACHAPGLSGAPRFGDVEAWAPRIAQGPDLLLKNTIAGMPPAMPPRGICMHCTDEDLARAIDYMVVNSQ